MSDDDAEPKWRHHVAQRGENGWRSRGVWLYGPETEAHAEWSILSGHGFGVGFQVGRNGMESDLGLDVYVGRLGALWLRLRSPWTKWLRVRDREAPHWYDARHYGFRLFPFKGSWLRLELGSYDGMGPKARKWREPSLSARTFLGLNRLATSEGASGMTAVPLAEGPYPAAWTEVITETRYTGPLGKVRDAALGPRRRRYIKLDIPGGIPCEGKGENSWDCGMDGVFGTSGQTVAEAVGNCVRSVLRNRDNYGGPHTLPHPMSITEAEAWQSEAHS